jgi:hypothetical protein
VDYQPIFGTIFDLLDKFESAGLIATRTSRRAIAFRATPCIICRSQHFCCRHRLWWWRGVFVEFRQHHRHYVDRSRNFVSGDGQQSHRTVPRSCAAFDQLGVRVPLIAVSPFSPRHWLARDPTIPKAYQIRQIRFRRRTAQHLEIQLSPDSEDDPFCACAETGRADFIVTLSPKGFPQSGRFPDVARTNPQRPGPPRNTPVRLVTFSSQKGLPPPYACGYENTL